VKVKDVSEASLGELSRLWLHEPDDSAMAAAYTDLFLLNVYPYGTAFTDPSGELNGPAAWESARRYEERGYRPPELFEVGAPDHVGLCIGFLEHLANRGEKDVEFSASVLEWIPICSLAVERDPSADPFYRTVAAATRERLMEDIPEFMPPTSEHESHPEEEEVGLSQIVRFLLAPARSGLFLSRAKLGQVAMMADMRLPFDSRFDVASMLFQTAGESRKVGTVLDLLEEELGAWGAAYQDWADEHPRWMPSAARWLHRTGETRRLLGQMREILRNPPELEYAEGQGGA
jgi:TorA maturation chaperone TorD